MLLGINVGNQSAFYVITAIAIIMFYLAYLGVTVPMLLGVCAANGPSPTTGRISRSGAGGFR